MVWSVVPLKGHTLGRAWQQAGPTGPLHPSLPVESTKFLEKYLTWQLKLKSKQYNNCT